MGNRISGSQELLSSMGLVTEMTNYGMWLIIVCLKIKSFKIRGYYQNQAEYLFFAYSPEGLV